MSRKWITFILMPVLMVVILGCPKKKPATVEPELEVVSEPVDSGTTGMEPEVQAPEEDMVESGLPNDIMELNQVARERGLLGDVFFDFDQADLRETARQRLADNAAFLRDNPDLLVSIEGHCDERGTNEYNLALGNRRSGSAADYIASLNVDGSRMRTISYGEERPFCTQSSEACWQDNRRAHFVITGRR